MYTFMLALQDCSDRSDQLQSTPTFLQDVCMPHHTQLSHSCLNRMSSHAQHICCKANTVPCGSVDNIAQILRAERDHRSGCAVSGLLLTIQLRVVEEADQNLLRPSIPKGPQRKQGCDPAFYVSLQCFSAAWIQLDNPAMSYEVRDYGVYWAQCNFLAGVCIEGGLAGSGQGHAVGALHGGSG